MSGMSLSGSSSGAYVPPSLDAEPLGPPPGGSPGPVFGQTDTYNPVHAGSGVGSSPKPAHPGVNLAPAAAEALTIQVDTQLDPNGFDISDGVADDEDRQVAAQMFRKREREQAYEADSMEAKKKAGRNLMFACAALMLIGTGGGIYAFLGGDGAGSKAECAENNTVVRHECAAKDRGRDEDVLACTQVVPGAGETERSACEALHRPPTSPGDPPGPVVCRFSAHTECRQTTTPVAPPPGPSPGSQPPPPPPAPTTAAESWDFIGGSTSSDTEGHYTVGGDVTVVWPGARSGSLTWTHGSSTFLLGGVGCGEEPDGICGDQGWSENGPEQSRTSIGISSGKSQQLQFQLVAGGPTLRLRCVHCAQII